MKFLPANSEPTPQDLRAARHLSLVWLPDAPEAVALVGAIVPLIVASEAGVRGNARREVGLAKLAGAVGAIVGGLMHRWSGDEPALSFRTLLTGAFTGSPVPFRQFHAAIEAMVKVGLVGRHRGISYQSDGFNPGSKVTVRKATRYWPTDTLLAMATAHGLTPSNVRAAFRAVSPTKPPVVKSPLKLLALGTNSRDPRDRLPIAIRPDDKRAAAIGHDVLAHNTMAAAWKVEGCCPPRWSRSFRGDWSLHGRWYALGADGVYQTMAERARVADIRLNGEKVAEIDIKASHLSVHSALARCPLPSDSDPYDVPGVPRRVVKQWIVMTLGKGSPVARPPRDNPRAFEGLDLQKVAASILAVHPALARPADVVPPDLSSRHGASPGVLLSHHLMAIEAGALTEAMRGLRERHRVLSLPMHDGLIVPRSAVEIARAAMVDAFERLAGFTPALSVETGGACETPADGALRVPLSAPRSVVQAPVVHP